MTVSYRHAVHVDEIDESPTNPRRRFDQDQLEQLAASIEEVGILQPVVLRPGPTDHKRFELVCGARRLRAARIAGLEIIPAVVRDLDDKAALEAQLVENNQRADVSPLDEARAFAALVEMGDEPLSIADTIGRSIRYVETRLRLLLLIEPLAELLEAGRLPLGAATRLAALPEDTQTEIARDEYDPIHPEALDEDGDPVRWTVRDVTEILRGYVLHLKNAQWDLTDGTLGGHGACASCEHRTGAQPDLWGEQAGADDKCLVLRCFREHAARHQERVVEAARAAGHSVVKGYRPWNRVMSPGEPLPDTNASLDDLVPDVPRTVYIEPNGRILTLVDATAAISALAAAGHDDVAAQLRTRFRVPSISADENREYWKRQEEERKAHQAAFEATAAAVAKRLFFDSGWIDRHLAEAVLLIVSWTARERVGIRRGLPKGTAAEELLTLCGELGDDDACALAIEALIEDAYHRSERPESRRWWRALQRRAGLDAPEPEPEPKDGFDEEEEEEVQP